MLAVSSALRSALEADNIRFSWLVAFPETLDKAGVSNGVYFTDHAVDIALGGITYVSLGDVLSLSAVTRERGIKLQSYTIKLAGADIGLGSSNASWLAAQNMTGQPCEISLVLQDAAGEVLGGSAIKMYRGTVQTIRELESGSKSTIDVVLTSPWSKPDLTAGRLTSENSQKDLYPGDDFFKFAHRERTNIGWGGGEDD